MGMFVRAASSWVIVAIFLRDFFFAAFLAGHWRSSPQADVDEDEVALWATASAMTWLRSS